ncbi:uncharacterized protein LOC117100954, partial [Anneissia japonica]|uniref:uncharacterized protein LOC117100954 n=1 Tax=Anneissia japonica TaxID=1529436 RepID=UPI001425667D
MASKKKGMAKLAAVFPVIEDDQPTPSEDAILRAVMNVVCSVTIPISIEDIVWRVRQRGIKTTASSLKHLLINYPDLVEVTCTAEGTTCTIVLDDVELCTQKYNTKKQKCSDGFDCTDLHLCKYFISGSCKMQPCKFPHDLHSSHNLAILQRLFLDEVRPVDLYSRLQEKFERKLKLCGFYDTDEGCKGGEMCQYLHLCRYHI